MGETGAHVRFFGKGGGWKGKRVVRYIYIAGYVLYNTFLTSEMNTTYTFNRIFISKWFDF